MSRRIPIRIYKTAGTEGPATIGTIAVVDAAVNTAAFVTFVTITPDTTKVLVLAEGAPVAWNLRGAADAAITNGEIGFFRLETDGITETLLGVMSTEEMHTTFVTALEQGVTPRLRFSANIRGGLGEALVLKGRNMSIAYDEAEASQRLQLAAGLILGATIDEQIAMGG